MKDINYWKQNAEDDYTTTPISVLRYITELENLQPKPKHEKDNLIKGFLTFFDGIGSYVDPVADTSTFALGLCDLKQIDDKQLEVTLRRPGLLIGKGGSNINRVEKYLDCKIIIVEKIF